METVAAAMGSEERTVKSNEADKYDSSLASLRQDADPVVYKLVRVDHNGRLIPATDDELIEVEDLLEYEKSEMLSVSDVVEAMDSHCDEEDLSEKPQVEARAGLMRSEKAAVPKEKLNARLEFIEEMLQKVNKEERHRLACGSPIHSSSSMDVINQDSVQRAPLTLPTPDVRLQSEIPLWKSLPLCLPGSNSKQESQSGCSQECYDLGDDTTEDGLPDSIDVAGSKPNFSILKGEIDLDRLTIRELHETFRAAFGRKTSVKDKQWLKRRIAMALTNSCDVSVTRFLIRDGKFVKEDGEKSCKVIDGQSSGAGAVNNGGNVSRDGHETDIKGPKIAATSQDSSYESDCKNGNNNKEKKEAKRVRKRTRRYIEESSDIETSEHCERLVTPSKGAGQSRYWSTSIANPASMQSSAVVMRHDSLGGSGVRIPFVSRVRRCRPRKSIVALARFQTCGLGMATKWVEKAVRVNSQLDKEGKDKILEVKSAPFEVPVEEVEEDQRLSITSALEVCKDEEPKAASSGDNSDRSTAIIPAAKGGIRRKHHRAWTLNEVVKLVDGVSKLGAGRWSEIKRLAFASYSYRTSVDLKDKWRNLLKASFANAPLDKGMNGRKNTTMPIPAPILRKVRELAMVNGQLPKNVRVTSDDSGASVNENRSGFL